MAEFWSAMRAARRSRALSDVSYYFADLLTRLNPAACEPVILAGALAAERALSGEIRVELSRFSGQAVFGDEVDLLSPLAEDWHRMLDDSPLVGDGTQKTILVKTQGSLYLHRYFDLERRLARLLVDRSIRPMQDVKRVPSLTTLHAVFGDDENTQSQREAARIVFDHRIAIISGGPGTGKTATVRRILPLMWSHTSVLPERTLLCAPTGKAAARLRETLVDHAGDDTESFRAFPANAVTIHRLLGWQPGGAFRYGAHRRLPCDLVIIDEASMVDLALMVRLFEALPDDARVILLGDRDQLASVEAGAVLGDMCRAADSGIWAGGMAPLSHNWRFGSDSPIAHLARVICSGDATGVSKTLAEQNEGSVSFLDVADDERFNFYLNERLYPFFESLMDASGAGAPVEEQFSRLGEVMVICAHRHGPQSVQAVNAYMVERLRRRSKQSSFSAFPGMPVMLTRNDPGLGLFNGDIGIVVSGTTSSGLQAVFPGLDGKVMRYSLNRLPEYDPAYAITTHKAQGSQARRVFFILPAKNSRVLSKELIYTGITRARESVEIWGDPEVLISAATKSAARPTGLSEQMQCL